MKNELYFVLHFLNENEKRMRVLKIQSKALLNMEMVVKYLNFVYHIEVKTKSNYKILNFVFEMALWVHGFTLYCITKCISFIVS